MSHELRTPLNSMLILAKLLAEGEENLTDKQREFARTIYSSGSDLLDLINEILDLSKIESGMMEVELGRVVYKDLAEYVERTFSQVAHDKGLEFSINVDPALPHGVYTDQRRLQQVLKNLLSNAFKFTERGRVSINMTPAKAGWNPENKILSNAESVVTFSVKDTGIGIAPDKHRIIFEAFHRPTEPSHADTAGRDWASRSAAKSRCCWAAKFSSTAWSVRAAHLPSICPPPTLLTRSGGLTSVRISKRRPHRQKGSSPNR